MRAVDVRHERVEPHDIGRQRGVDRRIGRRRERQRAGEEVHAEIRSRAGDDELLDLGIGLGVPELGRDLDDDELGHRQPERPRELARQHLRDERALALAGTAELRDVHAEVVGLDEPRQRPALAQGVDVAGGGDGAQRLEHGASLPARPGVANLYGGAVVLAVQAQERILVTIPISHYCEKARWALDRGGLEYTEKRHIQLVHRVAVKRAGGASTAPVLRTREGVYGESHAILLYADEHVPVAQRLYPAEEPDRSQVLALEQRFDTVLGPQGRLWLYHEVFKDARRFARWNLTGVPGWERRVFPFVLAPAKMIIRRHLGISDRTAKEAADHVNEEFDAVAERLSDGRRYLVGDRFSAADLAFAALAAPAIAPPTYGTPLPQPEDMHEDMAEAVRRWRSHPAGEFALRLFREERPPPRVTTT